MSVRSAVVSQFYVRPTPRVVLGKQSKWPCTMIHSMSCRNPCRLYIHISFTYSVSPSSVVWSELYRFHLSTNESAWSVMVTGSQSRVWSGPKVRVKRNPTITPCKRNPQMVNLFGADESHRPAESIKVCWPIVGTCNSPRKFWPLNWIGNYLTWLANSTLNIVFNVTYDLEPWSAISI